MLPTSYKRTHRLPTDDTLPVTVVLIAALSAAMINWHAMPFQVPRAMPITVVSGVTTVSVEVTVPKVPAIKLCVIAPLILRVPVKVSVTVGVVGVVGVVTGSSQPIMTMAIGTIRVRRATTDRMNRPSN